MSALMAARRRLAELAAAGPPPDERNEVDEQTLPPAPGPDSEAPLNSSDSFSSPPVSVAIVSADPAFADWSGSLASGLSGRLLASLRRQAAAGDTDAARQAVKLADYLAACDRGEVALADHPNAAALREWNRLCDARSPAAELKTAVPKPARRARTATPPLPAADG